MTKASRSTVASEYLEEVSEKKLIVPTVTCGNSFYDACARIIEMPLANINKLCTQLHIKCMNDKEHCLIMKLFTRALDILQGEDTCFYGTLLPTLEVLIVRTLAVKNGLSKMTGELPDIIVKAIKSRFAATRVSQHALLAAVSLLKFKLRWGSEKPTKDYIKFLLTTKCSSLSDPHPAAAAANDFFLLMHS